MSEKKRSRLTQKQKKYINTYIDTNDKLLAYTEAYGDKGHDKATLNKLVRRQHYRVAAKMELVGILDIEGLSESYIAEKIKELLEAKRPITYRGEIREWVPDNGTRLQALNLITDIRGIRQKQLSVDIRDSSRNNLIIVMPPEDYVRNLKDTPPEELEKRFLENYEVADDGE